MAVRPDLGYKRYRLQTDLMLAMSRPEGNSFDDPCAGQVQAVLPSLLQTEVCQEADGLTTRGMPSMRGMLFIRLSLPYVEARTSLPDLQ